MSSNMLLYSLGGASTFSVFVVTILNALAYGAVQSLSSSTRTTELAPVSLSAVSCVALIMLTFLVHKDVRHSYQWPRWKIGVFFLTVAYLIIAAGSTAGTMATNHSLSSLWIARSIVWGLSVFAQGFYCGYLLVVCFQQKSETAWPRSYNLSQELKALPDTPTSVTPPAQVSDPYPEMNRFDTRRGSLRKFPRRTNRDSGLSLELSKPKHGSIDTTSTTSTIQSPSEPTQFQEYKTRSLLRENGSIRSMPSLRHDVSRQLSLDTLVQPSPTASTFHLDSPTGSMETLTIQEHNIHPLFRSTSPCPSPTPTPGTRVKASPSAGQTITHQTLTRMRSARSLRESRPSPSPFLSEEEMAQARKEPDSGLLSFIDAGHVRRSITQYEKRYDLNESPYEN
ncbi:hypothetical protein N7451_001873 [Penicillium sp. IBT 35674x]|nr:hypothetical protein N7451_001873 [Penicillium sp. IBT 35674x]